MGVQQDAHELLCLLINSMGAESQVWGGGGWEEACVGQLCSSTTCNNCKNTTTKEEEFKFLSLEIPVGRQKIVLGDCWSEFFKEEVLWSTDGWKCGCCGSGTFATKRFSLTDEPALLVIHLKRFDGSTGRMVKRAEPVAVPLQFEPLATKFHLRGLVRHHRKTLSSGHYTAEVKEGEEWWRYDDQSVSQTTRGNLWESRDAYLLFYERMKEQNEEVQRMGEAMEKENRT